MTDSKISKQIRYIKHTISEMDKIKSIYENSSKITYKNKSTQTKNVRFKTSKTSSVPKKIFRKTPYPK